MVDRHHIFDFAESNFSIFDIPIPYLALDDFESQKLFELVHLDWCSNFVDICAVNSSQRTTRYFSERATTWQGGVFQKQHFVLSRSQACFFGNQVVACVVMCAPDKIVLVFAINEFLPVPPSTLFRICEAKRVIRIH